MRHKTPQTKFPGLTLQAPGPLAQRNTQPTTDKHQCFWRAVHLQWQSILLYQPFNKTRTTVSNPGEKTPPKTKPCSSFALPEFLLGSEIGLEEELDCQLQAHFCHAGIIGMLYLSLKEISNLLQSRSVPAACMLSLKHINVFYSSYLLRLEKTNHSIFLC